MIGGWRRATAPQLGAAADGRGIRSLIFLATGRQRHPDDGRECYSVPRYTRSLSEKLKEYLQELPQGKSRGCGRRRALAAIAFDGVRVAGVLIVAKRSARRRRCTAERQM